MVWPSLLVYFLFGGNVAPTASPLHSSCNMSNMATGKLPTLTCQFYSKSILTSNVLIIKDNATAEVANCEIGSEDQQANCTSDMFQYLYSNATTLQMKAFSKLNLTGTYSCISPPQYSPKASCTYHDKVNIHGKDIKPPPMTTETKIGIIFAILVICVIIACIAVWCYRRSRTTGRGNVTNRQSEARALMACPAEPQPNVTNGSMQSADSDCYAHNGNDDNGNDVAQQADNLTTAVKNQEYQLEDIFNGKETSNGKQTGTEDQEDGCPLTQEVMVHDAQLPIQASDTTLTGELYKDDRVDQNCKDVQSDNKSCYRHGNYWIAVNDWMFESNELLNKYDNNNASNLTEMETDIRLLKLKILSLQALCYKMNIKAEAKRKPTCTCRGLFENKRSDISEIERRVDEYKDYLAGYELLNIKKQDKYQDVYRQLKPRNSNEPYNSEILKKYIKDCRDKLGEIKNVKKDDESALKKGLKTCVEWEVLLDKYKDVINGDYMPQTEEWTETTRKYTRDLEELERDVKAEKKTLDTKFLNCIESNIYTEVYDKLKQEKESLEKPGMDKAAIKMANVSSSTFLISYWQEKLRILEEVTGDKEGAKQQEASNNLDSLEPTDKGITGVMLVNEYSKDRIQNGKHKGADESSSCRGTNKCNRCNNLPGVVRYVPPDGHCLLHAVAGAVSLTGPPNTLVTTDVVKQKLETEFDQHKDFYRQLFRHLDKSFDNIEQEFKHYLENYDYQNNTADLIIEILCNALLIKASIYTRCPKCPGFLKHSVPQSPRETAGRICIYLLLDNAQHYSFIEVTS